MERRQLGTTDTTVSALCLGTMTFGRQTDERDAFRQMDMALDHGIDFFDTAEIYAIPPNGTTFGTTETIIGRWLADRGARDRVTLATKIAGEGPRWVRGGKNRVDRPNLEAAIDGSLQRLRTDFIDLYQIHWPNRGSYHFGQHWYYHGGPGATDEALADIHETLDTLARYIDRGIIRHVGLSNETAWGTMRYLWTAETTGLPRVVSIQNEYNPIYRLFEPDLQEIALREKVGLLAWSPLATGMITGKYAGGARPEGSRWWVEKRTIQRDTPRAHQAVARFHEIAAEADSDPVQLAIAWVRSRPFVTSAIVGARTSDQLAHLLPAADLTVSEETSKAIDTLRREIPLPY